MGMKLTKIVPAKKVSIEFVHVLKKFSPYNSTYRSARSESKYPMGVCFWCNHKFEEGEEIALAIPKNDTNKVLCKSCVSELE